MSYPFTGAAEISAPELGKLMKLRDALLILKGPLANSPVVRNQIERRLLSNEVHERVLGKLVMGNAPRQPENPGRAALHNVETSN